VPGIQRGTTAATSNAKTLPGQGRLMKASNSRALVNAGTALQMFDIANRDADRCNIGLNSEMPWRRRDTLSKLPV